MQSSKEDRGEREAEGRLPESAMSIFNSIMWNLSLSKMCLLHDDLVHVRTITDGWELFVIYLCRGNPGTHCQVFRSVCDLSAKCRHICSLHLSHILHIKPPSLVSWKAVHYCILAAERGREIREAADQTHRQIASDRNTHLLLGV